MLLAVKRKKIRDVVAGELKAYIAGRRLKPGDRLPTETQLAAQFGVSRLSLREATKSLEFLGILEAKPGLGLTVGQVRLEQVTEYLHFHPALQQASAAELIETRIVIETGVLPHVVRRMRDDPAIYRQLNRLNDRLRKTRTLARWIATDIALHRFLVEASGLAPLVAFNDLLTVFFQRFRESVRQAELKQGIDSHQRLIDALRNGRLELAGDELRRHIESHKARMSRIS
jgi:DNA-binding FadR family transcriptional regulator